MKILNFINKFLYEQRKDIFLVLLIKIILMLIPFLFPWFLKIIIDQGIIAKNFTYIIIGVVSDFLAVTIRQTILIISFRLEDRVSTNVIYSIRKKMAEKLLLQSISFFEEKNQGDLLTVVNSDTERVENFALETSYQIVLNLIMLLVAVILIFVINWKLALLSFIPIVIFPLAKKLFVTKLKNYSKQEREATTALTDLFQQTFSNIYIILSYHLKNQILHTIKKHSTKLTQARVASATYSGLIGLFVETVLGISITLIVYLVGGYYVINNSLELGSLLAFSYYLRYTIGPIGFFYKIKPTLAKINASFDSVREILELNPKITDAKNAITLERKNYPILFDNVSFGYKNGIKIIRDFSYRFNPGSITAICGASGAGKSTLIKLLLRFHDVDKGTIKIGDKNIKDISIESLRSYFSVVPQDSYFFNKTIWENFTIIHPTLTIEEFERYIDIVGLTEKIKSLPEGLQTMMGESGVKFSGGERQRLSIARALIRKSPVIILDEATSQLDPENEKKIIEILKKINREENKTIIMVAHKLTTISKFKEIIVLENGHISEVGNHDELIKKGEKYHNLWTMQN